MEVFSWDSGIMEYDMNTSLEASIYCLNLVLCESCSSSYQPTWIPDQQSAGLSSAHATCTIRGADWTGLTVLGVSGCALSSGLTVLYRSESSVWLYSAYHSVRLQDRCDAVFTVNNSLEHKKELFDITVLIYCRTPSAAAAGRTTPISPLPLIQ